MRSALSGAWFLETTLNFSIKPEYYAVIRWNSRGSCGNPGCIDPDCGCALCGLPIGIPEDDPRWDEHDEWCGDCELCRDQVPLILFRGTGKHTQEAKFHGACFNKIIHIRSKAG